MGFSLIILSVSSKEDVERGRPSDVTCWRVASGMRRSASRSFDTSIDESKSTISEEGSDPGISVGEILGNDWGATQDGHRWNRNSRPQPKKFDKLVSLIPSS